MQIRPRPVIAIETIATARAAGIARMLAQSRCYCNAQEIVQHSPGIPGLFNSIPLLTVTTRETSAVSDDHPLAGQTMAGSDIVIQVLADEGVDTIFGYSGGAILPTYDAVFRYNDSHRKPNGDAAMPLIVPANEQGAGFMAAGYARASGKVGVVMVTSGPGATNTVTPVRDCMADSVPIVVICGQVPRAAIGSDAFQEAPVAAIMGAVAKHVFLVTDPMKLEATMRSAFKLARTGRPGPVVVDIPKDVQNWQGVFCGAGELALPGYERRLEAVVNNRLSDDESQRFYGMLAESDRPLIYAGGGVINANAAKAMRRFANEYGIPVTTTLMALGASDTRHPLALHMLGMHGLASANYAVEDCDFLIAIGARFDDRVAGDPPRFAPKAQYVAQFDVDAAEIGKVKRADWHHVGVLRRDLEDLLDYGRRIRFAKEFTPWHTEIAELKATYGLNYDRSSSRIQPYAVIEAINRHTKGQAIISTGVGQHQMWAAQYFDFREPRLWLTSGSMGTMGFGLPAAIGAQIAAPERVVIDVDGDASIRMNIGELETATTYKLPIKVLVLNNYGDGMVRQWQKLYYDSRMSASDKSLHKKDFVKAAQADGFGFAKRLEQPADIETLIGEFMACTGPAFLEVIIDPDAGVYPMVGPGLSYDKMITGEHIPSREKPVEAQPGPSEMF
jgi:acetolactate synthase I/II/III large subunit